MVRLFGYGLMLWAFMFAVSSALYPWSIAARPSFELAMAVVLAAAAAIASVLYLRGVQGHVLRQATIAACLWSLLCLALDAVMLAVLPPRLSVGEYLREMGFVYLVIPATVMAIGLQRGQTEAPHH